MRGNTGVGFCTAMPGCRARSRHTAAKARASSGLADSLPAPAPAEGGMPSWSSICVAARGTTGCIMMATQRKASRSVHKTTHMRSGSVLRSVHGACTSMYSLHERTTAPSSSAIRCTACVSTWRRHAGSSSYAAASKAWSCAERPPAPLGSGASPSQFFATSVSVRCSRLPSWFARLAFVRATSVDSEKSPSEPNGTPHIRK
mmetsp:Transcript_20293/g.52388  ORF Transcript_20293/g.52388 Transcript_20293/m.52388 type:complete len:202 (-) Transcript_20293:315-920(-)